MIKSELAQKLIEARESRQISLQDASRVLSIRVQVLQDLEDGRYERLGSLLYVKNYVRKYADYLKIDSHEIDQLLPQLEDPFKEEKKESLIRAQLNEDKRMVHRSFFKWYSVILMALLATGIATYFVYGEKVTDIFNIRPTPEKVIKYITKSPESENIVSIEKDEVGAEELSEKSISTPSVMMNDSFVDSQNVEEISDLDVKSALSKFEVEQIIREGSLNPDLTVMQEDSDLVVADDKIILPDGISSLSLTLNNAECWVQIRDKDNKVLMNEILPANATYHLEGKAPFSLHIGNAQSIDKLMFNGEVVDEKIYRPTARTTVSKIKLEPKEEN
ncbi:helix-turn-helix domain-containing protein [Wohlfahrtiimonas larvae]|uniref:Cytoskeleton protein RodZ n=1 Tax=Wohlfahrtiimonas larvae TaxID=1157986 RepID=A0ABP9MDN2_9GAMM|nr:RodZ domain-containing protein [Wohlfahrtiimonas larvae]